MALDMILLGFLDRPASGYDLKQAFNESVRHFWDASLSQIYPTLYRLHEKGLVTVATRPSSRGPDRKVYARTGAGTAALRRWLAGEPAVGTQRIEHLAQLFFLGQLDDPERTVRFLEDLRATFDRRLAALEAIEAQYTDAAHVDAEELSADTVHPYLTLLYGIRRIAATVAWCDECLQLIAELERGDARRRA